MEAVKNAIGKTICQVDAAGKTVVIVHKGLKTVVRFLDDGTIRVTNAQDT